MIGDAAASPAIELQRAHASARASRLKRHIVFAGFMGAGKSTFAALTAAGLHRAVFDSDVEIAARGRSIEDLFAGGDEPLFRAMEREVIAELLQAPPAVIALGGGALEDRDLRRLVFAKSFVIHLAVTWRDVQQALPELKRTRPLLQDRTDAEIHQLFLHRQHTYRQAHMRIQSPRGDPSQTVAELVSLLGRERT